MDGFHYECNLNGLTYEAILNEDMQVVNCIIPQRVSVWDAVMNYDYDIHCRRYMLLIVNCWFLWS